jgi:protein-L-isoaspartate(D-aspartate) O-methyltransferase
MLASAEEIDDREPLGGFLLTLRTRGHRDPALLTAIERAPRAAFLPLPYLGFAYQDIALPIGCGQEATAPFAVVEAVSRLEVRPEHSVLEIGGGSGWQTAILAGLARAVVSVERFRSLASEAERRIARLGLRNVVVTHGDGAEGLVEAAPFDRVIINAAVGSIPPAIAAQLAPGAAVVAPLIEAGGQSLMRLTRDGRGWSMQRLGPSRHPPLALGAAAHL